MKVPSPETYTLTKTVPFHQSANISKFIWRLHQECRWYFNKGVKMSFDNRKLTQFDLYGTVTILRNNTGWNAAYSEMQRASNRRRTDGGVSPLIHHRQEEQHCQKKAEERQEGENIPVRKVAKTVLSEETLRQAADDKIVPEAESEKRHDEVRGFCHTVEDQQI